jgi:hypothetical protein
MRHIHTGGILAATFVAGAIVILAAFFLRWEPPQRTCQLPNAAESAIAAPNREERGNAERSNCDVVFNTVGAAFHYENAQVKPVTAPKGFDKMKRKAADYRVIYDKVKGNMTMADETIFVDDFEITAAAGKVIMIEPRIKSDAIKSGRSMPMERYFVYDDGTCLTYNDQEVTWYYFETSNDTSFYVLQSNEGSSLIATLIYGEKPTLTCEYSKRNRRHPYETGSEGFPALLKELSKLR